MTDRAQEPSWAQEALDAAGGLDDLCPWQSCTGPRNCSAARSTFVLSTSGHIAAMVIPGNPSAG